MNNLSKIMGKEQPEDDGKKERLAAKISMINGSHPILKAKHPLLEAGKMANKSKSNNKGTMLMKGAKMPSMPNSMIMGIKGSGNSKMPQMGNMLGMGMGKNKGSSKVSSMLSMGAGKKKIPTMPNMNAMNKKASQFVGMGMGGVKPKIKGFDSKALIMGVKKNKINPQDQVRKVNEMIGPMTNPKGNKPQGPLKGLLADYDGDKVINMLDCKIRNPLRQGPEQNMIQKNTGIEKDQLPPDKGDDITAKEFYNAESEGYLNDFNMSGAKTQADIMKGEQLAADDYVGSNTENRNMKEQVWGRNSEIEVVNAGQTSEEKRDLVRRQLEDLQESMGIKVLTADSQKYDVIKKEGGVATLVDEQKGTPTYSQTEQPQGDVSYSFSETAKRKYTKKPKTKTTEINIEPYKLLKEGTKKGGTLLKKGFKNAGHNLKSYVPQRDKLLKESLEATIKNKKIPMEQRIIAEQQLQQLRKPSQPTLSKVSGRSGSSPTSVQERGLMSIINNPSTSQKDVLKASAQLNAIRNKKRGGSRGGAGGSSANLFGMGTGQGVKGINIMSDVRQSGQGINNMSQITQGYQMGRMVAPSGSTQGVDPIARAERLVSAKTPNQELTETILEPSGVSSIDFYPKKVSAQLPPQQIQANAPQQYQKVQVPEGVAQPRPQTYQAPKPQQQKIKSPVTGRWVTYSRGKYKPREEKETQTQSQQ